MLVPGKTDLWLCGLDTEAGHPTRAPNCQHGEEPSRVSTPLGVGETAYPGDPGNSPGPSNLGRTGWY